MAGLGDLFGGNGALMQIFEWQVVGSLVSTAMAPLLTELQSDANDLLPNMPLSPQEAASAVVRHFYPESDAESQARKGGISPDLFKVMIALAGGAPAPTALAVALRRGLIEETGTGIDSTSFEQGISEGDLANKWAPMLKDLAVQWPSPTDALAAVLEGQVSEAEGKKLYEKFGGNPDYFKLLFDTQGTAPTPSEALTMANRGIIPWTGTGPDVVSYQQAFLEGPWRNKWLQPYETLGQYLPPPRTVTAMVKSGGLDHATAAKLLADQGLTPALVTAYLNDATQTATGATKALTIAQVLGMYADQLLDETATKGMLTGAGYSAHDADLLIAYTTLQRAMTQVTYAVGRVRSLYVAHKISRATAASALADLSVPTGNAQQILVDWDVAAQANIKQLTEAQVATAFKDGYLTQDAAMAELEGMGYVPRDAWILLSIKHGSALPNEPAAGPAPVG